MIARERIELNILFALLICLLGLVISLFCKVYDWPNMNSSEWASWVQAIGTVGALGIAIWVPKNQEDKRLKHEKQNRLNEQIDLISMIHSEVSVTLDSYLHNIGNDLGVHDLSKPFDRILPIEKIGDYPIYYGNAGRLGIIDSEPLREEIIKAYSLASGLETTYLMNNKILEKYHAKLGNNTRTIDSLQITQIPEVCMAIDYAGRLRGVHDQAVSTANTLLTQLDHEKGRLRSITN